MLNMNVSISTWGPHRRISPVVARSRSSSLFLSGMAICLVTLVFLIRFLDTVPLILGLRRSPGMDCVIMKKSSAQIPDRNGHFSAWCCRRKCRHLSHPCQMQPPHVNVRSPRRKGGIGNSKMKRSSEMQEKRGESRFVSKAALTLASNYFKGQVPLRS